MIHMRCRNKFVKAACLSTALLAVAGLVMIFCIDVFVKNTAAARIITAEEASELKEVDCILVLGCLVREDGTPSGMLEDRLRRAVELYNNDAAPKLLVSGDHASDEYDEVGAMKQYAVHAGIPSSDVFMDHEGFSTYESVRRAKEVFGADKIVIVTQEYHLYRALYIAGQLGIEAYGVASDYHTLSGQWMRDIREIFARVKDFAVTAIMPATTCNNDVIPLSGDGDVTDVCRAVERYQ